MFSLRSTRKAASPIAAAGVSCIVAMLALTGCGGDDEPGAPPPFPSLDMPSLKPLQPVVPSISTSQQDDAQQDDNAAAGGPAPGNPATGNPAPTSKSASPPRIKLAIGDCVDIDDTGNLIKVSCAIPHMGQVGAVHKLPESTDPSAPSYVQNVTSMCDELLQPMLRRQDNAGLYALVAYRPSPQSWAENNDRDLGCIMTGKNGQQLNGPLK